MNARALGFATLLSCAAALPAETLAALAAAEDAGLMTGEDVAVLTEAWRTVSRVRNAITLVRGMPADQLPGNTRERAAVAMSIGYRPGATDEMVND